MTEVKAPARGVRAIQIEVDWSDEPAAVYANDAQVSANPRDVSIVFTEFQPITGRGDVPSDRVPKAKIVANVRHVAGPRSSSQGAAKARTWPNNCDQLLTHATRMGLQEKPVATLGTRLSTFGAARCSASIREKGPCCLE